MRRWVVTGPIAGGKSLFTRLLAERGAAVVDGDELGHRVLADPKVAQEIAAAFGPGTIRDGEVDRAVLGAVVFNDAMALERLNAITHGRLSRLAETRLAALDAAGRHELAVLEAAVYFLLPEPPRAELVIAVTAGAETRLARLAERGGLSPAQARARVQAQAALESVWRRADVVIENDGGPAALAASVDAVWRRHYEATR